MAEMPFGFANDKAEAHTRKQDQQLKSGNPDMVARGGAAPRPEPKKLLRFCGRTNGKIRAANRPPRAEPEDGQTTNGTLPYLGGAGWSSPVARQAHNLKVTGSNPVPATKSTQPID